MERLPVIMVYDNLDKEVIERLFKSNPIPEGFYIRNYRRGEENLWAEIETAAGEFETEEKALEHFQKEFGPYLNEMEKRCFFIVHKESGRAVGTTTAWYNDNFKRERYGRIHWVGVHPDFQGKKLAKPLLAAAMMYLAEHHCKAYLTSQTTSYKAINMYLDFGFKPEIMSDECKRAWNLLEKILGRTI
ncbi:MAG: GNAT family N-acetyltransferase [Firmicutes bacterium]|nr:GNAT family N-acetyltransferase [Bacillota bacterium]